MDITIDCGTCSQQNTSACNGCVVTFLAEREPDEAVVLAMDDYSALRRLETAGLVPKLRHDEWNDAI